MEARRLAADTIRDRMRSLDLYREDVRRAGLDLDAEDKPKLNEIAVGWK